MVSKLFLVLAVLPLAFAWPSDWEKKDDNKEKEMFMKWKAAMMEKKKEEFVEWKGKHESMVEKFKDYKEEKQDKMKEEFMEWKGKQEAMKNKFMAWKDNKMEEQKEEYMEYKKKAEMKSKMEEEGMEEKMKMMKKFKMWGEKMEYLEHFEKMMQEFNKKKHYFVGKVVYQTLQFCQCKDTNKAMMEYMSGGENMGDGGMGDDMGDMGGDMGGDMDGMNDKDDMKALAEKIKKMSDDDKKKLFLKGMIKTLCAGAKAYALHVAEFKLKYLD